MLTSLPRLADISALRVTPCHRWLHGAYHMLSSKQIYIEISQEKAEL